MFANGKIFTASDTIREADAMTVENGRITWIGKKRRDAILGRARG